MEVTRENFEEVFPIVEGAITHSTFVSIDLEFSGLNDPAGSPKPGALDSQQERYYRAIRSVRNFATFQVGICAWKWKEDKEAYVACPFTFYVFPPNPPRNGHPTEARFFGCEVSSMHFLATNGFDFNKTFHLGIGYLTPEAEKQRRTNIENKYSQKGKPQGSPRRPIEVTKEADIAFVKTVTAEINNFVGGGKRPLASGEEGVVDTIRNDVLYLNPLGSFHRRLVYELMAKIECPDDHVINATAVEGQRDQLAIQMFSKSAYAMKIKAEKAAALAQLQADVGFRRVLDAIGSKLVVAHNSLLDLCHMMHHFYGVKDETFEDWKEATASVFPCFMDTKMWVKENHFLRNVITDSQLQKMVESSASDAFVESNPEVLFADKFKRLDQMGAQYHDGGYDAYCTGLVFLRLVHFLKESAVEPIVEDDDLFHELLGRVFLARSSLYINLLGPEVVPDRSNVFYVDEFKSKMKTHHFVDAFKPFGSVTIHWESDTSLMVELHDRSKAATVLPWAAGEAASLPFRIRDFESVNLVKMRASVDGAGGSARKRSARSSPSGGNVRPVKRERESFCAIF